MSSLSDEFMKKLLLYPIALVITLLMPVTAFASVGTIVSGPSGSLSNGWYKSPPTMVVDSNPSCPTGGYTITLGGSNEGKHRTTVRSYLAESFVGRGPTIDVFDYSYKTGVETGQPVWACRALDDGLDHIPVNPEVIWQGEIQWDATAPSISISSPSNNANTDNGTVSVSGSVSDTASGVQSVTINGVTATLSGANYSASVPVSNGLNTLTATATDNAGNTAQAQVVVNRIDSCGGACSATTGSTEKPTSTSTQDSTSQPASNSASNEPASEAPKEVVKVNNDNKEETPTLVKGVVQGGSIGLATILAFVVVLLLLDRFRIIEIKAFAKISDKLSKSKTTKTKNTSKKASQ